MGNIPLEIQAELERSAINFHNFQSQLSRRKKKKKEKKTKNLERTRGDFASVAGAVGHRDPSATRLNSHASLRLFFFFLFFRESRRCPNEDN